MRPGVLAPPRQRGASRRCDLISHMTNAPETGRRRPRIAQVANADTMFRFLLRPMLASSEAGFEVQAVCSPSRWTERIEAVGIPVETIEMKRTPMSPVSDALALLRLYRFFRREHFDIAHTHNPKPGFIGRIAASAARVPIVVHTIHGYHFTDRTAAPLRAFHVMLDKIAARRCDCILSVNREDVAFAVRTGIADPGRISLLSSGGIGIDLETFDPSRYGDEVRALYRHQLGIPDGHRVVGTIAPFSVEKGAREFLEAAARILEVCPDVFFLSVGPTGGGKGWTDPDEAGRLGIADRLLFLGWREDIPELLSIMDVYTLPSHREGFPVSAMEASAMALPLVLTDIRGCRELVEDGVNGRLVPAGDAVALADAIIGFLENENWRARVGKAARRRAMRDFDEKRCIQRTLDVYVSLLIEKGLNKPRDGQGS